MKDVDTLWINCRIRISDPQPAHPYQLSNAENYNFCDSFLINFLNSLYKIYETNKYKPYFETQCMNVTTDKRLFISEFEIYEIFHMAR